MCFRVSVSLLVWKPFILLNVASMFMSQDPIQKEGESFPVFLDHFGSSLSRQWIEDHILSCNIFLSFTKLPWKKKIFFSWKFFSSLKNSHTLFSKGQFLTNTGRKAQDLFSSIPKKVRRCEYIVSYSF